ncbi:Retrotransposon nucleocapsid protein, partial [Globisporangium splendens]
MQQDVKDQRKNGRLMPIPIPEQCWQVVSMDFITGLPLSEGYDAILTVVDKLSKRAKYAPTHAKDGAPEAAKVFFDTIVHHHGLPEVVNSDRDSKFTSKFWTSLMKFMGIRLSMTTSHRPQADGQTERQNLVVEDALRCMVSYQGTDWVQHLGMTEYAHTTLISASTGFSPFEIDTGRKERNVWEQTINSKAEERGIAEYAKIFAEERQKIVELARKNLIKAQETQKKYYDRKRRVHQVEFKAGDLVMLDTSRVSLKHAASETDMKRAKFAARKIGPLEIIRMINPNVAKLKLPAHMKRINPTFNVDVLSHYVPTPDKFLSRPIPKSSKFVMDDSVNNLQIVEKVLKKRQFNRQPEWLVQWHGETEHEATWERERDIRHVAHWTELVADFKERQREIKSRRIAHPDQTNPPIFLPLVNIAETRHKFKEWREGEAGTLKAARDQVVHNLKTEYELKIARHHEEKQKLCDKVKDLEVSLRLLQRDRNLSAVELSLRKATILGSKEMNTTTEAEFIEANSRIKELEALLNHAKEYQKREVVALENLTLQPMAALTALPLSKVSDPTDSTHLNRFSVSLHSDTLAVPTVGVSTPHMKTSVEMDDSENPRSSSYGVHHQSLAKIWRCRRRRGERAKSSDPEKEILRRQSIVLSAKVEKRRSHHGMLVGGPNGNATNLKEQYLFSEVLKLQAELNAMKEAQKKHERKKKKKLDASNRIGGELKEASGSDEDDDSSSSSSSSESSSSSDSHDDDKSDGDVEQGEERASDGKVDTLLETLVRAQDCEAESITEHDYDADSEDAADTKTEVALVNEATNESDSVTAAVEIPADLVPAYIPEVALEAPPSQNFSKDTAVKVIQSKSKTFIIRRAFLKKKVAVDKIKAQYRGYLVRKNVELLDRHHQKQFAVTQAMQYKMQIVAPHHEMTCKCHGLTFKLVLRVSKDPPIVQVQMHGVEDESRIASNDSNPLSRFDQPMHDELDERASETEIAETFAALLSVVRIGGQYKFSLQRKKASVFEQREYRVQFNHLPGGSGGSSILNELYVESMLDEDTSRRRGNRETREKHAADDAKELEDLIRNTRIPLADDTLQIDFNEIEANIATRADHMHLKKMLRRMSSSAPAGLDTIPESPRSMRSKFL